MESPIAILKFNVDGSTHGTLGNSIIGGVLRKSKRQILGMFSLATGDLFAYEAKLKAILHALLFCQQFQFHHLTIESDSSLAFGWVSCKENKPHKLLNDLNLIDLLVKKVGCVGIHHISQESNPLVVYLAICNRQQGIWSKSIHR